MDTKSKIQEAIRFTKEGNKEPARKILSEVVKSEPNNEYAWYFLAQVVEKKEQVVFCLEKTLRINPNNEKARKKLNTLQAPLQSENIEKTVAINDLGRPGMLNYVMLGLLFIILGSAIAVGLFFAINVAKSPEQTYAEFKKACDEGDIATAESFATVEAIVEHQEYGVCILTHDSLNRYASQLGIYEPVQEFVTQEPEVEITGNTAYLKWTTEGGSLNTVVMFKTDGDWKVRSTTVFGSP